MMYQRKQYCGLSEEKDIVLFYCNHSGRQTHINTQLTSRNSLTWIISKNYSLVVYQRKGVLWSVRGKHKLLIDRYSIVVYQSKGYCDNSEENEFMVCHRKQVLWCSIGNGWHSLLEERGI